MSWPLVELGKHVSNVSTWSPLKSDSEIEFDYIDLSSVDKDSKTINTVLVPRILPSQAPSRARQLLKNGDVIVSTVRPNLNGVALVSARFEGATASTGYCILRTNGKSLDRMYLYYWVQTNLFISDMMSKATGANYPAVSDKIIKNSKIPLPPLKEQKRIAAILAKADKIRQKRQQAIKLADDFLRNVFLEMFGSDLQRSNNVVNFGDISILDAKMVDPREEQYLDLLHIGPDRITKNTGKLLPALTAREERLISKKFLFDDEYILYSKIRPYLRKVAIPEFSALCSADMYPVKPVQGKVTRQFLWSLLLSDYFDNYVSSLPARANIPKLNKTELASFEFSLPDFIKIEKYTEIVKMTFNNLIKAEANKKESEKLFNSLSQKAFAGDL